MLDIPNLMVKHIDLLLEDQEKYSNYIKNGYKFEFDFKSYKLIVTYKNKEYKIKLIEENKQLCWCLTPYNHSSFITNIDNGLEIVLFAIKENEELYSSKKGKKLYE